MNAPSEMPTDETSPSEMLTGNWPDVLAGIQRAWPAERYRDVGVVVGTSGGADSVGLLLALNQLRGTHQSADDNPCKTTLDAPRGFLVAAHYHHGVRGQEADADQDFVRQLASQHRLQFVTEKATDVRRDEAGMSAARMDFLTRTAKRTGARYIALAHSVDDNVETFLHHLMRGTGPSGLAAMGSPKSIDNDLVLMRPLLNVARQTIRDGLVELEQAWREDASNQSTQYARNWIRHQLLPVMTSRYPGAVGAISRAIEGQRDWRDTMDDLANRWLEEHLIGGDMATFRRPPADRAKPSKRAIVIAGLQQFWRGQGWPRQAMTQAHWHRLAAVFDVAASERFTLPGQIVVTSHGDKMTITREFTP